MQRSLAVLALVSACSASPGDAPPAPDADVDASADANRDAAADAPAPTPAPPRIVLFIGDGMGPVHEDITSRFVSGAPDALALQQLAARADVATDSLSGVTDSAAAATAMASGVLTVNGLVGVDATGAPLESIFETARALGVATGAITTTALPHATPAGFTAHVNDRYNLDAIAVQQLASGTEVLLGGGAQHFASLDPAAAGYQVVATAAELAAVDPATTPRLLGAFAPGHFPYLTLRPSSVPSLEAMTAAALAILERDPDGFVLVVEGGRVDHASHANLEGVAISETAELDRAVAVAQSWARGRDNVTLVAVADHETGGLDVVANEPAGTLPQVTWQTTLHTGRPVHLHISGAAAAMIDGGSFDLRVVHELVSEALTASSSAAWASTWIQ